MYGSNSTVEGHTDSRPCREWI
ncbi:hypothetical protein R3I93_020234 [Phoxinus phoxinus]|uniref:Uncharacterized protein n=1 Tax=Phoxinus phoxinus TaxID=58324 RepID=A0AAN9C958_9TELE